MVHLYRLICALLLASLSSLALADGGAFPATGGDWDTSSCYSGQAYTPYHSDPYVTETWACKEPSGNQRSCGYYLNSGAYGMSNYFYLMCYQTKTPASCPAGATASTGPSGESLCTCTAGLRPSNGQCVASPSCPEGQHEEGGACVPDACKPNETRVNGVCVPEPPCPAGQTRVNGKCVPSKCPSQGTVSDQWYEVTSTGTSATCLYNSTDNTYCTMSVTPSVIARSDGRITYMGGYGVYTGGTCGPSEPGKPTPQDPDKPEGDPDKGTKPAGPNDPKPADKPGAQPGGPGNNPTPPGPDGKCPEGFYRSNGNCYQKDPPKQPPDNDGKCPSGYVKVGSECVPLMPPEDKDPDEKDPSTFGGQCEAVTCDGDAIQCAIARDQYRRSCQLMDKESAESQLYAANKGKEGNQTGSLPGNETISLQGRIDTSDALGGGSCFGDLNITVWNQAVTLPLSSLCQYLAMLGNILVAVSMLMAARIVTRG